MRLTGAMIALLACVLCSATVSAQEIPTSQPTYPPLSKEWPTYNGDYTGDRFSSLTKINDSNVKSLALAWTHRITPTGGNAFASRISATPVEVDGVLYFSVPNFAWAVDAQTGQELWHFAWKNTGGSAIGNRGVAVFGNTMYFETPDCNLIALNTADGKERWHSQICNTDQMYFGSAPPVMVKNHLIVGVGGDDFDIPGYLQAVDPADGHLQWRWSAHPEPGTPEAATWPDVESMMHGGGMTWISGTYDPELNLYYFGTGNAQPVINGRARPGANLYTACIIALNPDTGKLAWYFQPNPHDSHDWDAVETPVLIDGVIDGHKRKLLAQASRNGWFFVLDRTTGKAIVSAPFAKQNWASGVDDKGQPIPNLAKTAAPNGTLVSPNQGGATNWPPPSFSPATGLFYVASSDAYSVYYLFDTSQKPEGWAGNDRGGWSRSVLRAIDYKTGKLRWSHEWPAVGGRSGLLTTAGNLLFAGDSSSNLVALNAATGTVLWHAGLTGNVSNGPITYELNGLQYVVVAAGDTLYAFTQW